jgi:hypothetical protein
MKGEHSGTGRGGFDASVGFEDEPDVNRSYEEKGETQEKRGGRRQHIEEDGVDRRVIPGGMLNAVMCLATAVPY